MAVAETGTCGQGHGEGLREVHAPLRPALDHVPRRTCFCAAAKVSSAAALRIRPVEPPRAQRSL
jgi:hypothetical protein